MKVLLVVHGYPPEKFGGTETYTRWLAHALVRRGHSVSVFTRTDTDGEEYELAGRRDDEVVVWSVRNTYSIHNEYEMHYRNPHVEESFAKVLEAFKPDVVHFTYLLGGLSAGFVHIAKSKGIKTVVTLTDFHHLCPWGQMFTPQGVECDGPEAGIRCAKCFTGEDAYAGVSLWKRLFYNLLSVEQRAGRLPGQGIRRMNDRFTYLQKMLKSADTIIFPTQALGEQYRWWGVDGRHIPFGLDESLFDGFERTESDKFRLAFIGQLSPHKGLHILTEALRGLSDIDNWTLDIYAALKTEEEKKYLDDAMSDLEEIVFFKGTFDPLEIGSVYENMDALVIPSLWTENSPLVILYAIHTRTPLISAMVLGVHEVAGDWGIYYYPPENVDDLKKKLRKTITEPDSLDRPDAPEVPGINEHAELIEKVYMERKRWA